jgi:hypothetical protein
MMEIPLDATVICTDGYAGRSTYVIIDPTTKQVTHLVVQLSGFKQIERLASVSLVKDTTNDTVRLRCKRNELAALEPFIERRFIERERPRYDQGSYLPYPQIIPQERMLVGMEFERVPKGKQAVHRGADVYATDGRVGKADQFLVDPSDNRVTHLVLREGHLWNERDVRLPVSAIDRVEREAVRLTLDKQAVGALLAVSLGASAD